MGSTDTLQKRGFGETSRRDRWWLPSATVVIGFTSFILYATWAGFQAKNYFYHEDGAHYLSPFYSPLLYGKEGEPRWIAAEKPSWWPAWLPFSAAFLILAGPAGMRTTCYYYRGAYYKAYWADPPGCAVGEPRKSYWGENSLPLILQNVHRYFFYIAVLFVVMLSWDALRSFWFENADGSHSFGIGVGTIVITLNAALIGGYTFGCHCSRHFAGGSVDCLSKAKVRKKCYDCVSALNRKHMQWAWVSLVWVMLTDVYIRLCASGVITDWRII